MESIDAIFLHIGDSFCRDTYFLVTKIQGILWSIANTVLVFYFLRITDLIRTHNHMKQIRYRYYFLLVTAILPLFLLFAENGTIFFALEAAIYGIQYTILLYSLILERKELMHYFREIVSGKVRKNNEC
jgi:hypothetical protein